jgi:hypothetical protein
MGCNINGAESASQATPLSIPEFPAAIQATSASASTPDQSDHDIDTSLVSMSSIAKAGPPSLGLLTQVQTKAKMINEALKVDEDMNQLREALQSGLPKVEVAIAGQGELVDMLSDFQKV